MHALQPRQGNRLFRLDLCGRMDAGGTLLLQLGNGHGQEHGEGGSPALALTRGPNRAAVLFHQLFADRQPQAQTAVRAGGRGVLLRESLEDVWKIARRNADARIADTQLEMRIHPLQQTLWPDASSIRVLTGLWVKGGERSASRQ